jgi:hypothetical protein
MLRQHAAPLTEARSRTQSYFRSGFYLRQELVADGGYGAPDSEALGYCFFAANHASAWS